MSKYYQSRPLPADAHYGAEYWTSATDPDGKVRDLTKEREQKLSDMSEELAWLSDGPPGNFLDVGCGLGWATEYMQERGWRSSGVEPDDFARIECVQHGRASDVYPALRSAVHALGFNDALTMGRGFNAALCYHVIEHMEIPTYELDHLSRLLYKGAKLVVSTPDFGSPIAREYGDRFRLLHDKTHISLFSSWGLVLMLHEIGFEVEDVRWPFFGTRHHTSANLDRLKCTSDGVSPAGPGNIVSVYARKR